MSIAEVMSKPVSNISLSDFQMLVELEAPESTTLEFKRDLQTPDGAKGWLDIRKLNRGETKGLAKEIVAFANTDGGRIFIGIEESKDDPPRAVALGKMLQDVEALRERLADGLNGLITPAIRGLELKAVVVDAVARSGYILIDVPRGQAGPYGMASPPECYWRRGSSSQPMVMQDIHNLFWEHRSRRERIILEQNDASARFKNTAHRSSKRVGYRFTAVSERVTTMKQLTRSLRSNLVFPLSQSSPSGGVADYPIWNSNEWQYSASGSFRNGDLPGLPSRSYEWSIDETGVINVQGFVWAEHHQESMLRVDPWDFTATISHLILLATYVNRYAQSGSPTWIIDGEIVANVAPVAAVSPASPLRYTSVDLRLGARIRPIAIDLENDAQVIFHEIEERVWASFNQPLLENGRQAYQTPSQVSSR